MHCILRNITGAGVNEHVCKSTFKVRNGVNVDTSMVDGQTDERTDGRTEFNVSVSIEGCRHVYPGALPLSSLLTMCVTPE